LSPAQQQSLAVPLIPLGPPRVKLRQNAFGVHTSSSLMGLNADA
jgi:hypothetical protein